MKKMIFIIFILLVMTNCGVYRRVEYHVHSIDEVYDYNKIDLDGFKSLLAIQSPDRVIIEENERKLVVLVYDDEIRVRAFLNASEYYKKLDDLTYYKTTIVQLMDDIKIIFSDGKKMIIKNKDTTKAFIEKDESDEINVVHTGIPIPNEFDLKSSKSSKKNFILDIGRVKIEGKVYRVPRMYIKKYKVVQTWSLLGSVMMLDPLYENGRWIYDKDEDKKEWEKKRSESLK